MRKALAIFAIGFLSASPGFPAERRDAGAGSSPLEMEELEVRGLREKPGVLYLPVHRGIVLTTPVRHDLFLEDMARPVLPGEMVPEASPDVTTEPEGASHD